MTQVIVIAQGIEIRDMEQGLQLQSFLKARCDPQKGAVWTYPKGAKRKPAYEVRLVYDLPEFAKALDTAEVFVVYEGHSRYGQGPAFGPAGAPKVPDKTNFPINPWGVHFRMGYDATATECLADLLAHSVTPAEYDLLASGKKAFLPGALVKSVQDAREQQQAIKAGKIKGKAVCGTKGAWRLFSTCDPVLDAYATARGDRPLKGRHYNAHALKVHTDPKAPFVLPVLGPRKDDFYTAVDAGSSADLKKSKLSCKLLFMASCSSKVHFYPALRTRREAARSECVFLLTANTAAATHARNFLEQVLINGHQPTTGKGMKSLIAALNSVKRSGLVRRY